MLEADGRDRLYIRLGKRRRDRKLAAYIAADIEQGVNVSRLVKDLLYDYYTGAPMPTHAGPGVTEPDEDTRQVALSAKLKKLSFDSLSRQ
jgi:hypothetical protein